MADTFTLDTSGVVRRPGFARPLSWSDLDPFEQRYIEALLQELQAQLDTRRYGLWMRVGFRHLAPETLAAMLKDCEATDFTWNGGKSAHAGKLFWKTRQAGGCEAFPPVRLFLSEDGLVRQEVARG